ncbi:hypothetical protein OAK47_00490 [Planctomycetaceae bacterium]|nr:hypothetical protein [bacterium]MDC0261675.1 hypothetical protein [Planctomycetaceae bacterium]MDG2388379.1 transporter associated domain-containing protein [Planctomycetaceae bacterium]
MNERFPSWKKRHHHWHGDVDDEFDTAEPRIVPEDPGSYLVLDTTPIEEARDKMQIPLNESAEADTVGGLLMEYCQKILGQNDSIEVEGAVVEVLEMKNDSATKLRFKVSDTQTDGDE